MDAIEISKKTINKNFPDIRPGDTVRVFERVKEGEKTRVARFEGIITARKHGSEPGASITVRKISFGVGVERLFPLASPVIEKIELVKRAKVRRANLNFLRKRTGKAAMLRGELVPPVVGTVEPEVSESVEAPAAAPEVSQGGEPIIEEALADTNPEQTETDVVQKTEQEKEEEAPTA